MTVSGALRKPVEQEKWLTVKAAADMLGIHRQTVLNRALAGDLETIKIAGRHFVSRASVEAVLSGNDA